jgi:hypothetical protein
VPKRFSKNAIVPTDMDNTKVLPVSLALHDGRETGVWREVKVYRAWIEDTLGADALVCLRPEDKHVEDEFYQVEAIDGESRVWRTLASFSDHDKTLGAARDLCAKTGARLIDMTGGA